MVVSTRKLRRYIYNCIIIHFFSYNGVRLCDRLFFI